MGKDRMIHERFMHLALRLARRAKGQTSPNPLVGAVVAKGGKVVAWGYHKKAGLAHAEVMALDKAGKAAQGATLYVTLEPCRHFGQTPPCVTKIKACGIKKVVLAMHDPNPLNSGRGAAFLRRNKIKVISGVLEKEAQELNQVFIKYIRKRLPFVTVKIAQSLDGKIATAGGDSRWISSLSSRKVGQQLRSQVDAILVGINTVLTDDPLLSCRVNGRLYKRQPKKVIVDSRLRLISNMKVFSPHSPAPVLIATTRLAPKDKSLYFSKRAEIIVVAAKEKKVDLKELFRELAKRGIAHILIEGGGEIISSALKMGLVDRMIIFLSPKIIGGRDAPTSVDGEGIKKIKDALELKEVKLRRLGSELLIEGKPVKCFQG